MPPLLQTRKNAQEREHYTLASCTFDQLKLDDLDCSEYHLVNPLPDPTLLSRLSPLVNDIGPVVYAANEIACGSLGSVKTNTLVLFTTSPSETAVGMAMLFCKCISTTSVDEFYFAGCAPYHRVNDLEWAPSQSPLIFIRCTELRWLLPYLKADEGKVIPFMPREEIKAAWE